MLKLPTMLVVGQAVHPTGYARVLDSVLSRISAAYKIHHFGLNYRGKPIVGSWRIHPNRIPGDIHGAQQVPQLIRQLNPDLVWIFHDLYLYSLLQKHIPWDSWGGKLVVYFPIENCIEKAGKLKGIEGIHRLVLYNQFAKEQVLRACAANGTGPEDFPCPPLQVVGHGLDREKFYPAVVDPLKGDLRANRVWARRRLFPDRPELADAFIVLNANRNSMRKRIDLTMEAFAMFAKDKPRNVYLYLHMGMRDRGFKVLEIAHRLGIENRLLLTSQDQEKPHINDELLNLVYNACDVGLNTSTGEGWGLVAFEHAATGAAQIMPAHGTLVELWQESAVLVEPTTYEKDDFDFVAQGIVAPADIAGVLEEFYHKPDLLRCQSLKAYRRALAEDLDWSIIAGQWHELFCDALTT